MPHSYVIGLQLEQPQNVTASSPSHPLLFTFYCSAAHLWRRSQPHPGGIADVLPMQFPRDGIMFDILTFARVICYHSSPLMQLLPPTGQLGQHQHHTVVLPWSPPAVCRGITPGGWVGGSARVKSSRWVIVCDHCRPSYVCMYFCLYLCLKLLWGLEKTWWETLVGLFIDSNLEWRKK